ncbi:MAG: hypothetical protein JWN60_1351 [Acidobacteria bacterium]|jgi:hypothetical protein|nr:hypothetical protein [Acidobacteriota bacterium]
MQSNSAVVFSPILTDEKKVEVSLRDDQAVIKLSTWTEDLGWCAQKTLSLDSAMLEELQKVISAARIKLQKQANEQLTEDTEKTASAKILQFPIFS